MTIPSTSPNLKRYPHLDADQVGHVRHIVRLAN